ncbi:MAG: LLM class F420-dependent oxidoreductase [Acidimicrobiia bacterium]
MKIDAPLVTAGLDVVPPIARSLEDAGYDGVYTFEGPHDPFFPLVLAADATERIDLATAVAIAFARSPMTVANIAYDLQRLSGGRFALGLGSQIKPHIEKRFSMPWSHPAPRMREFVLALRAIWGAWQDSTPLRFEGDFYRHTLMTPFFDPGPNPFGLPRVWLAGVGPAMTEVAGEVGDGFIVHPFSTERYLREHLWPHLARGLDRSGRTRADLEVSFPVMVVTGKTEADLVAATVATKAQIAFYGSTPAYRVVLDAHGWGELQGELNRLSKAGDWGAMAAAIDDDMLTTFAVRGTPQEVAATIAQRYGDVIDRVACNTPYAVAPDTWAEVLDAFSAYR